MIIDKLIKKLTDDKGLSGLIRQALSDEEIKKIAREALKEALVIGIQKGMSELNEN